MRQYLLSIVLLVILFFLPLQVFVIGNGVGIGIQGAVFRVQITQYGDSFILITQEIMYVIKGFYTGRTALSIIMWAAGTLILTITTWFGIAYADKPEKDYPWRVCIGITGSCICYLISCIAQYGILFHGQTGTSIPFGIIIILFWLAFIQFFRYGDLDLF